MFFTNVYIIFLNGGNKLLIVAEMSVKIRVHCFFREMFNQSWNKYLSLSSDYKIFNGSFFSSQKYGRLSLHRFLNCTHTPTS